MSLVSTGAKESIIFEQTKYFGVFFSLRLECELCVYRQEKVEIEMITQFSFGHN